MITDRLRRLYFLQALLVLLLGDPTPVLGDHASEVEWAAERYFRQRVEPILRAACFDCHSHEAKSPKAGLYLDSKSGWELGGTSGPAILPGNPEESLLIQAVRDDFDELQMPPKKTQRLSQDEVAILEQWVKAGAYDPRSVAPVGEGDSRSRHWAFRPIERPGIPTVQNEGWVQTPVDAFVLRRLEDQGLSPTPAATRRMLIRRVYFDLIGLPPTLDAISRFELDSAPDAYGRLVDELLASPHHGERWARHWLDVSRYADTKGYVFQEERRFPYSYTFRDYVVDSFNRDLPYDQFIKEQLAADMLPASEGTRGLAGMGFLTLGRRFLNNQHDIIDDRIDVVTRGLMGLTVSCARCHDHKFDPIPTKDYYSLYGVFASAQEPSERPILEFDENSPQYLAFTKELGEATKEWDDYRTKHQSDALAIARRQAGEYLKVLYDARELNRSQTENLVKERQLGPVLAFRWKKFLEDREQGADPIFQPWFKLFNGEIDLELAPSEIADRLVRDDGDPAINSLVAARIQEKRPTNAAELANVYGALFQEIETEWKGLSPKASGFADSDREAIRQIVLGPDGPASIPLSQATQLLEVKVQQRIIALKRSVDRLPAVHPGAPARAMSLVDRGRLHEPVVFLRGNSGSRGPRVPRQFLSLIEGEDRQPFAKGSGRLELAEAIVSPENPLTARVIVNRIWRQHFGRPLVDTPSDFGVRAETPSHPQLLDFLASRLMSDGWSLKRLHRMILLSNTYRQSSAPDEVKAAVDPENRYLWRMNRRRLELEPLRDTLLAVAGALDSKMGGQPVEITKAPFTPRRTLYGFIERQNLPSLFRTFDLASPDTSSPGRFETTVPQQALFMVNSPFIQDLARGVASLVVRREGDEERARVDALFRQVLQRDPTASERQRVEAFLQGAREDHDVSSDGARWEYGYRSNSGQVEWFNQFKRNRWSRGGAGEGQEPYLTEDGGRLDEDGRRAVVRRWTAPYNGVFDVELELSRRGESGEVRARLLTSTGLEKGSWTIGEKPQKIELQRIALDLGASLVLQISGDDESQDASFKSRLVIRSQDSPNLSDRRYWDSKDDFAGPRKAQAPLTPFARLAQVLLMSNELVFVD